MRKDKHGELVVEDTHADFLFCERLDFRFSDSSFDYHLFVRAICDVVHLFTDNSTKIEARKCRDSSLSLELFRKSADGGIGVCAGQFSNFAEGLRVLRVCSDDILPTFNCHGLSFTDSKFWINDSEVEKILTDDCYEEETSSADISVVIFRRGNQIVHSAKRFKLDNLFKFESKEGLRGLRKLSSIEEAGASYQPCDFKVYKYRTTSPPR